MLTYFGSVQLFATPWTVTYQAPLSLGFSRQEYWSGLPCPPPGDLPNAGTELVSLMSRALAGRFFATNATWEDPCMYVHASICIGVFLVQFFESLCITLSCLKKKKKSKKGQLWNVRPEKRPCFIWLLILYSYTHSAGNIGACVLYSTQVESQAWRSTSVKYAPIVCPLVNEATRI